MKRISRVIGIASLISVLVFTAAFASGDACLVQKPSELGKVTLTVETGSNNSVLVMILPAATDIGTLDSADNIGDSIRYIRSITADKDGKAVLTVELPSAGAYKAYAKFAGNDRMDDDAGNEFYFVTADAYKSIIDRLNTAIENENPEAFQTILTDPDDGGVDNRKALGFVTDLSVDYGAAANILYGSGKAAALDYDIEKNRAFLNACIGVEALKEDKVQNVFPLFEEYLNTTADFAEFSSRHIHTENAEKKFSRILKNEIGTLKVTDLRAIDKGVKTALLLTVVNYPENSGANIKEAMTLYRDLLSANGLTALSDNARVYDGLKGKNLASIPELVNEYKKTLEAVNGKNTGGSGGSSGGGGGNNPSLVSGGSSATLPSGGAFASENETIDLQFEDLDGVGWAYSAISRLFEKKVIAGYSATQFKPSNNIKREEFVKLLVCAMGLPNESAVNVFTDVAGDWSEPYVATAFAHGIVKGISGDTFGKGMEIKRQDMALMIYNALLASGYVPGNYAYGFSDEASDYAKSAIAELSGIGVVNGVGEGLFQPFGFSTRAQAAVIIDRAMQYFNKGE